MRRALLNLLVCSRCRDRLALDGIERPGSGEILSGQLLCQCGEEVPIVEGIPRFGWGPEGNAGRGEERVQQVRESFSFKWQRFPHFGFGRPEVEEFYDQWFSQKLGFDDLSSFETYLLTKRAFLDAGTGLGGKIATFCRINPVGDAVGVDFSDSVEPAWENTRRWPNAHILKADLMRLPFPEERFDLIVSDGVLHHTPDPQKAFEALVPYLAPGGEIAIHVYRRMGPIREFCDDFLRAHTVELSPEACWEFCVSLTRFGEALAKLKATIEVPEDLPILGVKAGTYDLQRFIYYHVFKCFWNPDFTFEENNLVNFDWYHPAFASRHDEEEIVGWFWQASLDEIRVFHLNESGLSVMGRRRSR